jgi:hypothetical protein
MALLGLVIEQPNQTVSHYARVFNERFSRSRFATSTAHTSLPQMARGRSVRVRRTFAAPDSDGSMDRYEATERGVRLYRQWMLRLPRGAPAIREAMYGRIELARLEHLPRLIRMAREEEDIATGLYAEANAQLRRNEMKRRSRVSGKTPADFEREVHETLLYVDPLHWSSRATLYAAVAEQLERIAEEAGIDLEAPEELGELGGFGA